MLQALAYRSGRLRHRRPRRLLTSGLLIEPSRARDSELLKKLNPVQQFPTQDMGNRAFDETEFPAHAAAMGVELTADEYYLMVLAADNGGQFYSRENAPGAAY